MPWLDLSFCMAAPPVREPTQRAERGSTGTACFPGFHATQPGMPGDRLRDVNADIKLMVREDRPGVLSGREQDVAAGSDRRPRETPPGASKGCDRSIKP